MPIAICEVEGREIGQLRRSIEGTPLQIETEAPCPTLMVCFELVGTETVLEYAGEILCCRVTLEAANFRLSRSRVVPCSMPRLQPRRTGFD